MIFASSSSARTKAFAARVARWTLQGTRLRGARARSGVAKQATVIALSGELGSGKTTFVQGFARALGVRGRVASPTFIMMRRMPIGATRKMRQVKSKPFAISHLPFTNLYHIDAYRLQGTKALAHLEFARVLADPKNVILIEWAERVRRAIPKKSIHIVFRHGKKEHERTIRMIGVRL